MIGNDALGSMSKDISIYSVQVSLTMMMYLTRIPVYTIMFVSVCNSYAFLAHVEKQVKEFAKGSRKKMLHNDTFFVNFKFSD